MIGDNDSLCLGLKTKQLNCVLVVNVLQDKGKSNCHYLSLFRSIQDKKIYLPHCAAAKRQLN